MDKTSKHLVPCPQEKRIIAIENTVAVLERTLNGTDGLMSVIMVQVEITRSQGENIDKLVLLVDALRVKDIATDKELEVKRRLRRENTELLAKKNKQMQWFVGAILTVLGLIVTYISFFGSF